MKAIFLHDPADLDAPIPGGVQLCSREFLEIVRAAADAVHLVAVSVTRSPWWRVRRKLGLGSYLLYNPAEIRTRLARELASFRPTHVFLNRSELMRLAPLITELSPETKTIVMSHGNQSGDDLYELSGPGGRRSTGLAAITGALQLGLDLVTESRYRHRHLHGVCVMSLEEEMVERWLGATRTVVLPRMIQPRPLEWKPVTGRVGFVGTLNHTPNRVALDQLCQQIANRKDKTVEIRLVGGPEKPGLALAQKYSFINYLGRLDDDALKTEVATWSLFLNPIFWLSRGASMKLGQSLAWAVPALTTRAGSRGYELAPDQVFLTEDSPVAFAEALLRLAGNQEELSSMHARLVESSTSWPDANALAARLRDRFERNDT